MACNENEATNKTFLSGITEVAVSAIRTMSTHDDVELLMASLHSVTLKDTPKSRPPLVGLRGLISSKGSQLRKRSNVALQHESVEAQLSFKWKDAELGDLTVFNVTTKIVGFGIHC